MLAKRTRDNQITIPKEVIRQAGMTAKERNPPQAYAALLERAFIEEEGDVPADSNHTSKVLTKRSKKR